MFWTSYGRRASPPASDSDKEARARLITRASQFATTVDWILKAVLVALGVFWLKIEAQRPAFRSMLLTQHRLARTCEEATSLRAQKAELTQQFRVFEGVTREAAEKTDTAEAAKLRTESELLGQQLRKTLASLSPEMTARLKSVESKGKQEDLTESQRQAITKRLAEGAIEIRRTALKRNDEEIKDVLSEVSKPVVFSIAGVDLPIDGQWASDVWLAVATIGILALSDCRRRILSLWETASSSERELLSVPFWVLPRSSFTGDGRPDRWDGAFSKWTTPFLGAVFVCALVSVFGLAVSGASLRFDLRNGELNPCCVLATSPWSYLYLAATPERCARVDVWQFASGVVPQVVPVVTLAVLGFVAIASLSILPRDRMEQVAGYSRRAFVAIAAAAGIAASIHLTMKTFHGMRRPWRRKRLPVEPLKEPGYYRDEVSRRIWYVGVEVNRMHGRRRLIVPRGLRPGSGSQLKFIGDSALNSENYDRVQLPSRIVWLRAMTAKLVDEGRVDDALKLVQAAIDDDRRRTARGRRAPSLQLYDQLVRLARQHRRWDIVTNAISQINSVELVRPTRISVAQRIDRAIEDHVVGAGADERQPERHVRRLAQRFARDSKEQRALRRAHGAGRTKPSPGFVERVRTTLQARAKVWESVVDRMQRTLSR